MQHLTAKKLLPRPAAPWHHSFCSSCWCNQSAWREAELTEVLALRSTEHFKAKGWNPGHAEVSGNSATDFNEPRISPGEFPSVAFLPVRFCCGQQGQHGGKGCGAELKGNTGEVHPGWENCTKLQRFWQQKQGKGEKKRRSTKINQQACS